mmetsp:Transcript_389/g.773  ORF Transcript_389/g.773 Transcript_389/m.773 type:complete len:201 (+) Transcript_389:582-1184(+)
MRMCCAGGASSMRTQMAFCAWSMAAGVPVMVMTRSCVAAIMSFGWDTLMVAPLDSMSSLMKAPPRPITAPHEMCGKSSLRTAVSPSAAVCSAPSVCPLWSIASAGWGCKIAVIKCWAHIRAGMGPEMVAIRSRVPGMISSLSEILILEPDSSQMPLSTSPPLPMIFDTSRSGSSIFRYRTSLPSVARVRLPAAASLASSA